MRFLVVMVLAAFALLPSSAEAFSVRLLAPPLRSYEFPEGVVRSPDGDLWFTTNAGRVGRRSLAGRFTMFAKGIVDGGNPSAGLGPPVVGGDGVVWFGEKGVAANGQVSIGRITMDGRVTEYPSGSSQVGALAPGPDGAIWYGVYGGVARMDASGRVQQFPVPGLGEKQIPTPLVAAGDGQLWFVMSAATMGRITTSGVVSVLLLPQGVTAGDQLLAGPGGGVWFAGSATNSSGRSSSRLAYIADSGHVVIMGPGSGFVDPLAEGPRGSVWYASSVAIAGRGVLGLISPTGRIIATSSVSELISQTAAGPDHSLWFLGLSLMPSPTATTAIAFGQIVHTGQPAPQCLVPRLVGVALLEARSELAEIGCLHREASARRGGATTRPLVVVGQRPSPGSLIPADRSIVLRVAAARQRYGRCRAPAGALTFIRTRLAVLVREVASSSSQGSVWGCLTKDGKMRRLFSPVESEDTYADIAHRVAGPYVATETLSESHYYFIPTWTITVEDLRTGHAVFSVTLGDLPQALALSRHGAVAWQTAPTTVPDPALPAHIVATGEIYAHDRKGTHRLDTSGPLDLASLHFAGDVLHWTDRGTPHQAALH